MTTRSIFRFLFLAFMTWALDCHAWTPQQCQTLTQKSLIATSAATMPFVEWSAAANAATYDGSSVVVANTDALQIPALAAYCAVALWLIPQTVKSIKTTWPDDKR